MEAELKGLRIDRSKKQSEQPSPWATGSWVRGSTILAKPNNAAIASGLVIRKVTNIFHP